MLFMREDAVASHRNVSKTEILVWPVTLLLIGTPAFGQCLSPPAYRVGQVFEDSQSAALLAISIRGQDFAPERLVCLASVLRQRYGGRQAIDILIFSDHEAASRWLPVQLEYDSSNPADAKLHSQQWQARQLHGLYSLDAMTHEEYVLLKPWGYEAPLPYDTRIDLPAVTVPKCRLELSGRCVLILDVITYPETAYRARVSGTVTLAGTISRDGRITHVTTAQRDGVPNPPDALSQAALENIRTWRLESRPRDDSFRVAYSYVIDSSLAAGQIDVQFGLPNNITVKANPVQ